MITSCVVGTRKTERETRVSEKAEGARVHAHPGPTEFVPRQSGLERVRHRRRLSERKRGVDLPSAAGCVGAATWWSRCKQSADVKSEHRRILFAVGPCIISSRAFHLRSLAMFFFLV